MKSIQCNIKNKWEESRFLHSYSFYRRLCHFQINVWWSKQPLHDIKSSSVTESRQRTAQHHGAVGWSDVRLYLWESAKDRDIKKVSQAVLFLPSHSSVPSYKTTGELTRQQQKGKISFTIHLDKYNVLIQSQSSVAPFEKKTLSFPPVQLLSLQVILHSHSYSEQTVALPLLLCI